MVTEPDKIWMLQIMVRATAVLYHRNVIPMLGVSTTHFCGGTVPSQAMNAAEVVEQNWEWEAKGPQTEPLHCCNNQGLSAVLLPCEGSRGRKDC